MITISLREMLDAVGYSNASDAGNRQSAIKNLLSIDSVRSAISLKFKSDYASNRMATLTANISNQGFKNAIISAFDEFIEAEENAKNRETTGTGDNPAKVNLQTQKIDHLKDLLLKLRSDTKNSVVNDSTAAGSQFAYNVDQYNITLSSQEVGSLSQQELGILGALDIKPEVITPKQAIFMSENTSKYKNTKYPTYTGVDMRTIFITPHMISKNITVKVLSYSTHAGLIPVSTLGRKNPKGFAEGDEAIAGSMIASITVNDPLFDMQPLNYGVEDYAKRTSDIWRPYILPSQFPRFDLLLLFTNEKGFTSALTIFGIKLTDTGSTISMSDAEIEITYTYTALDIAPLRGVAGETADNSAREEFNIMENNEYLMRRKMAYDGKSQHRSQFEIASVYGKIDRRLEEVAYNNMRMNGMSIVDVYNYKKFD